MHLNKRNYRFAVFPTQTHNRIALNYFLNSIIFESEPSGNEYRIQSIIFSTTTPFVRIFLTLYCPPRSNRNQFSRPTYVVRIGGSDYIWNPFRNWSVSCRKFAEATIFFNRGRRSVAGFYGVRVNHRWWISGGRAPRRLSLEIWRFRRTLVRFAIVLSATQTTKHVILEGALKNPVMFFHTIIRIRKPRRVL